jgi:TIR domain
LLVSAVVFLDSRNLKLEDDWDNELGSAQEHARVTVVLVTSNTHEAYYEREEISNAIALARSAPDAHRVVPLIISSSSGNPVNVPYGLRLKHALSLTSSQELRNAATKLINLLQSLDVRPTAAPAADSQANSP